MAVKKTAGKTTRVSPQKRDEGKKVASRKATSGTVSAATSKSAQKAKAEQLSKPGKVTESGMANIPASIMRLGKVAIDAYRKGTQAAAKPTASLPKSNVKVIPSGTKVKKRIPPPKTMEEAARYKEFANKRREALEKKYTNKK
jgi:hypothetical protein